jgi:hypothetical protein
VTIASVVVLVVVQAESWPRLQRRKVLHKTDGFFNTDDRKQDTQRKAFRKVWNTRNLCHDPQIYLAMGDVHARLDIGMSNGIIWEHNSNEQ